MVACKAAYIMNEIKLLPVSFLLDVAVGSLELGCPVLWFAVVCGGTVSDLVVLRDFVPMIEEWIAYTHTLCFTLKRKTRPNTEMLFFYFLFASSKFFNHVCTSFISP